MLDEDISSSKSVSDLGESHERNSNRSLQETFVSSEKISMEAHHSDSKNDISKIETSGTSSLATHSDNLPVSSICQNKLPGEKFLSVLELFKLLMTHNPTDLKDVIPSGLKEKS